VTELTAADRLPAEPDPEPNGRELAEASTATTGDPRVDEAVARLHELDALPTPERVPVLEEIHGRLQDALADLDNG
jgi:hypothetical protein